MVSGAPASSGAAGTERPVKLGVSDLRIRYGGVTALEGVTLDVREHEIFGIIGPANAGKTSFRKAVNRMDMFNPHMRVEGRITFNGLDTRKVRNVYGLRRRIGVVFPLPVGLPLSVYDNVALAPRLGGQNNRAELDIIVERCLRRAALWDEVKDRLDSLGSLLSGGQQQDVDKEYVLTGARGRPSKAIHSFRMDPKDQEEHNWKLMRKYKRIEQREVRYETFQLDDAQIAVIVYGTAARIAKGAIKRLRKENLKVGMIRPKTLWPFPAQVLKEAAKQIHDFFVFEMSAGQLIEDVKLALEGKGSVHFYGRPGGVLPAPVEIYRVISRHYLQSHRKRKV